MKYDMPSDDTVVLDSASGLVDIYNLICLCLVSCRPVSAELDLGK